MVTGRYPIDGLNKAEIGHAPIEITSANGCDAMRRPDLSNGFVRAVERALARTPENATRQRLNSRRR